MKKLLLSALLLTAPFCVAHEKQIDRAHLQAVKDELNQFFTKESVVKEFDQFFSKYNVSPDVLYEFIDDEAVQSILKEIKTAVSALIITESKSVREALEVFFLELKVSA